MSSKTIEFSLNYFIELAEFNTKNILSLQWKASNLPPRVLEILLLP